MLALSSAIQNSLTPLHWLKINHSFVKRQSGSVQRLVNCSRPRLTSRDYWSLV